MCRWMALIVFTLVATPMACTKDRKSPKRGAKKTSAGPLEAPAADQLRDAAVEAQPPTEVRFCDKVLPLDVTKLECDSDKVRDLAPIRWLTKLKSLSLIGTRVSDLSPLGHLTSLEKLRLDYTRVTDLSPISKLTKLTSLSLGRTSVSDLAPLTGLSALQSLQDSTLHFS